MSLDLRMNYCPICGTSMAVNGHTVERGEDVTVTQTYTRFLIGGCRMDSAPTYVYFADCAPPAP